MRTNPNFFLTAASEMHGDLARVRGCWAKGRLRDAVRDDYMLIEVDPPVIGQPYGLGGEDITELLISTRHLGFSLFPSNKWPACVYVIRILNKDIVTTGCFGPDQVELIAWAEIFPTLEELKQSYRHSTSL